MSGAAPVDRGRDEVGQYLETTVTPKPIPTDGTEVRRRIWDEREGECGCEGEGEGEAGTWYTRDVPPGVVWAGLASESPIV